MNLIRRTGNLIAIALLLGCSSDSTLIPKQGLQFEFAQWECGPADGPAMAIYLTREPSNAPTPTPPFARIYIDLMTANLLDGRQVSVGDGGQAFATFVRTDGTFDPASGGYIIANYSTGDQEIVGWVDLTFKTAGHLVRAFRAPVFPNSHTCP